MPQPPPIIRRRPSFTPTGAVQRKNNNPKKKDSRKKSALQVLGDMVERYYFLNNLARAPAGIAFGQIANGDVDKVSKELPKIIANNQRKNTRTMHHQTGIKLWY